MLSLRACTNNQLFSLTLACKHWHHYHCHLYCYWLAVSVSEAVEWQISPGQVCIFLKLYFCSDKTSRLFWLVLTLTLNSTVKVVQIWYHMKHWERFRTGTWRNWHELTCERLFNEHRSTCRVAILRWTL